jgi:hypothetical protein
MQQPSRVREISRHYPWKDVGEYQNSLFLAEVIYGYFPNVRSARYHRGDFTNSALKNPTHSKSSWAEIEGQS